MACLFLICFCELHYTLSKEARSLFLLQEIQYLKTLLKQVERGLTREEIKKDIEHNPFDDWDFFGWKGRTNGKK